MRLRIFNCPYSCCRIFVILITEKSSPHKVAISNHCIKLVENRQVSFEYEDYRKNGRKG